MRQRFGSFARSISTGLNTIEHLQGGYFIGKEIILAGGTTSVLRSEGYIPGSAGLAIFGDGSAEFNDVTIRGDLYGNWDGDNPVDLSSTFDAGATTGFAFDSSEGAAQFMGDVWLGGDMTLIGGGVLRTATSGNRIEISTLGGITNKMQFFSGHASETNSGNLTVTNAGALQLATPSISSSSAVLDMAPGSASLSATAIELQALSASGTIGLFVDGTETANVETGRMTLYSAGEVNLDFDSAGTQKYRIFARTSDDVFGLYDLTNSRTWFRYTANAAVGSTRLQLLEGGGEVELGGSLGVGVNPALQLHVASAGYPSAAIYSSYSPAALTYASLMIGESGATDKSAGFGFIMDEGTPANSIAHITFFGSSEGSQFNMIKTGVRWGTNTIWHAGNDGSGSGLDADTVRGIVPTWRSGTQSGTVAHQHYIGVTASAASLRYDSDTFYRVSTSSESIKSYIKPVAGHKRGNPVLDLTPVWFRSREKADRRNPWYIGLTYEEVAEKFPEAADRDPENPDDLGRWDVNVIVAALLAEVQTLRDKVAKLEEK